MKVYFIGAGPGDPELITVKGSKLVSRCPVVMYAGSLVPKEVISWAKNDAKIINSASLDLDDMTEVYKEALRNNHDVARVHTGDPSLFGAIAEQIRRLDDLGIEWEVIPGVSSFLASAAALGQELTLPEVCQSVIITRMEGRTPVPEKEKLVELAKHEATMAIFLSVGMIDKVVSELLQVYPGDYPIAIVQKASWPDQKIVRGTLNDIVAKVEKEEIKATAMILVSKVLGKKDFNDSKLYDAKFTHDFRVAKV